jgi:hypothetical protein
MTPVPNATRRQVISAFRFHSGRSPAESSALLTAFAVERGLSSPRRPPPGSALEEWATAAKAPSGRSRPPPSGWIPTRP